MSWRPIAESDVDLPNSVGCTVTTGTLSFLLPQGGTADPNSSSYYACFVLPKKKIRVTALTATVQPFSGPPPAPVFTAARVAGYETTDEDVNTLYSGITPLAAPLVGWSGYGPFETTVEYLDFHGANTGGEMNEQTAEFAVEVWGEGGDDGGGGDAACFWTDEVRAVQTCADAPPDPTPTGFVLADVTMDHPYLPPGLSIREQGTDCNGGAPYMRELLSGTYTIKSLWQFGELQAAYGWGTGEVGVDCSAFEQASRSEVLVSLGLELQLFNNGGGAYYLTKGPNFSGWSDMLTIGDIDRINGGWPSAVGDVLGVTLVDVATDAEHTILVTVGG